MIYTKKIEKAIKFAIKTHEVYQKQTRKGKDIAYITHPLTVGLILSQAGAGEDLVVAGILHDTIEDSPQEKPATSEMIEERFGKNVAELVMSVTEKEKDPSWDERKRLALKEIKDYSYDSVLLKSADVAANLREILDDYAKEGDKMFERFNASKEKVIQNKLETIEALLSQWQDNPLKEDLESLLGRLEEIGGN